MSQINDNECMRNCAFDEVEIISFSELNRYIGCFGCVIIDLRSQREYIEKHIEGAINIVFHENDFDVPKRYRNKVLIFYCDSGERALKAADIMKKRGCRTIAVADRFIH